MTMRRRAVPRGRRGNSPLVDERIGWHEHVVEHVDDQIEHIARPAGQDFGDPQAARKGAVDAIDDQRDAEPHEHLGQSARTSRR